MDKTSIPEMRHARNDLSASRLILREVSFMADRAARSHDPRGIQIALAVLARVGAELAA
jgi:hypothetical protein